MPYRRNADLPPNVRGVLPLAAQALYRRAFNGAWCQYAAAEKRTRGGSQEDVARRVAWAAVKKRYRKGNGGWVAR